nr:MAG TPA: hypothetical protein [Caudoviricetes sp.]
MVGNKRVTNLKYYTLKYKIYQAYQIVLFFSFKIKSIFKSYLIYLKSIFF